MKNLSESFLKEKTKCQYYEKFQRKIWLTKLKGGRNKFTVDRNLIVGVF